MRGQRADERRKAGLPHRGAWRGRTGGSHPGRTAACPRHGWNPRGASERTRAGCRRRAGLDRGAFVSGTPIEVADWYAEVSADACYRRVRRWADDTREIVERMRDP